ncbi:MAG TPA: SdpI family protein [Rhizomicrobium sp.]|nr:SdpI family protein [Rhizomicrobium sp.]
MSIRLPLTVSLILVLAMLAASAEAWRLLPEGARIAVHWDIQGRPNGFAGKPFALFFAPVLAAALCALFALIPRIEPRRLNLAASAKFYGAAWMAATAVIAVAHAAVLAAALNAGFDNRTVVAGAVALMLVVLGNYMGKSRSNFFAGVRTPWTLSSEYSWERSNRLGGRLFMMSGAATLAAILVLGPKLAMLVLAGTAGVSALASVAMSYVYWARDPNRQQGSVVP